MNVVQVHPGLRCNLRCLHCYSNSSPERRDELAFERILDVVDAMPEHGFHMLAVSGGEPLMYRRLAPLLQTAKERGLLSSVTSNAMLLTPRLAGILAPTLDLLAVSLDGAAETHNHMRGSSLAFERMSRGVQVARAEGIRLAFVFTLTRANLQELPAVLSFARDAGAVQLQIHPLELVGRARHELGDDTLDADGFAEAVLGLLWAQSSAGDSMHIHLDVADRDAILEDRGAVEPPTVGATLGDIVRTLIVEPDGAIVPAQFGFSREYGLGIAGDAPFAELAARWRRETEPRYRALIAATIDCAAEGQRFFNWYDLLRRVATEEIAQRKAPVPA